LIGAEQFARMKTEVRIVNCARGSIINEDALYDALTSGKVGGVALDVFAESRPPIGNYSAGQRHRLAAHWRVCQKPRHASGAEVAQIVIEFAKTSAAVPEKPRKSAPVLETANLSADSSHDYLSRSWHPHPRSLLAQTRRRLA
jgi:phosphoglycerate dehydrogenase-like enzyme